MKLLLTSSGLNNQAIADIFLSLFDKKPADISVLMVSHAQNSDEQFYIEQSKKELVDLGIKQIKEFDLKSEKFEAKETFDAIYVCGGNTFAILDRMKKIGLDKFIITAVKTEKSIYIGVSAGSIIAGPSIDIAGWGSEGDKNEVGLTDLSALNLTMTAVFPHFKEFLKEEVDDFRKRVNYPVIELFDGEAFFDNKVESKKIS